jgi:hypothetical protein
MPDQLTVRRSKMISAPRFISSFGRARPTRAPSIPA